MNDNVIIVAFVLILILFIILLDIKEQYDDLEDRIKSVEEEFYTEKLFKTDNQRFDLALQMCVKKLVSEELEKRRADNGK
jgi:predicted Holliday junction resolvase-like endonuclease